MRRINLSLLSLLAGLLLWLALPARSRAQSVTERAITAASRANPAFRLSAEGDTLRRLIYVDNYDQRLADYINQSQAFRYRKPTHEDTLHVARLAPDNVVVTYLKSDTTRVSLQSLQRAINRLNRRLDALSPQKP